MGCCLSKCLTLFLRKDAQPPQSLQLKQINNLSKNPSTDHSQVIDIMKEKIGSKCVRNVETGLSESMSCVSPKYDT